MPKAPQFAPRKTDKGWRINIPAKFSASGKRERYFYPSKEKALEAARGLRERRYEFGERAGAISPSLAEMAVSVAAMLEPFGMSLLDAAKIAIASKQAVQGSVTLEEAKESYLRFKSNRSEYLLTSYGYMFKGLEARFAGRNMATIRGEELRSHLDSIQSASSHNLHKRLLAAFIHWCEKSPREWCKIDTRKHLESREETPEEIGVLSSEDAARLLSTAAHLRPKTVAAFAIALFTGIRWAELERMKSSDISEDGITVPTSASKTKRRRFIHMSEPLAAWLKSYPVKGPICPAPWLRHFAYVRRSAGWRVYCKEMDGKPYTTEKRWPRNALRHTAATLALAMGKPIETLVFEHGHVGNLNMLRNHYIGLMTKKEAEAIWSLRPDYQPISGD